MTTSYPTGSNSASDSSKKSSQLNTGSFDIRDHLDKLQPGKDKGKYTCPVCGGRNLSVEGKTGKYKCFTSDCAPADIREAIKPLSEFLAERNGDKRIGNRPPAKKTVKEPQPTKVAVPIGLTLVELPACQSSPEPHKPQYLPKGVPAEAQQITYVYSDSQSVLRFEWLDPDSPKGRDKTYRQTHVDGNGKRVWTKGDLSWPAYRIDEVVEVLTDIPDGEPVAVLMLEGEPNVELARSYGIAALTLQGSNWNDAEITKAVEALRATGKNVTLVKLRDNDTTGIKKGAQVQSICD